MLISKSFNSKTIIIHSHNLWCMTSYQSCMTSLALVHSWLNFAQTSRMTCKACSSQAWPLCNDPYHSLQTTMWDTFLSFFTRKYQSYNITMLLCFKLDASTLVDIFTKVIKNTKKNVTQNMLHFITIMVILFIIILSNKSFFYIITNRLSDVGSEPWMHKHRLQQLSKYRSAWAGPHIWSKPGQQ